MATMVTMTAVAVTATVAPHQPRRAGDGDLDGGEAWALRLAAISVRARERRASRPASQGREEKRHTMLWR